MTKKFIKVTEDFVCEKCGEHVEGDGYTNHCPECLWSKHVDNNPGDRASGCGGMMKPSLLGVKNIKCIIRHTCIKCGHRKNNKSSKSDNILVLINI